MSEGIKPIDQKRQEIITHNLGMMRHQMMRLLNSESIGGNAGSIHTHSGNSYVAGAANGYVDDSGKILVFENYQNVPENIRHTGHSFTFHVGYEKDMRIHVINLLENQHQLSLEITTLLKECAELFLKSQK